MFKSHCPGPCKGYHLTFPDVSLNEPMSAELQDRLRALDGKDARRGRLGKRQLFAALGKSCLPV